MLVHWLGWEEVKDDREALTAEGGGIKGSFGYWCHFELLASWSCFVERTTVNKLVNGKFITPACGLIKLEDRG